MSDTVDNFWIESEHDIRDRLAKTEQKIGTAVRVLAKGSPKSRWPPSGSLFRPTKDR